MELKKVGENEDGSPNLIRTMTAEEIKERLELNIKNTATAGRQRVLEYLAKRNGLSK